MREFMFVNKGGASVEGEGHRYRPWGFLGGGLGYPARLDLTGADGKSRSLPSKVPHMNIGAGSRFECVGPSGGGYGDPFDRDPALVREDVLDGFITAATAERDYGVKLTAAAEIDGTATETLRQAKR